MTKILLDTDVVINLLKKDELFVQKFLNLCASGIKFYYNPIIIAEVYAGAFENERKDINNFFDRLINIDLCKDVGIKAGLYANKYKKAYNKISLEDYLIASCASKHSLYLWTNNKKHYPMDELKLIEHEKIERE